MHVEVKVVVQGVVPVDAVEVVVPVVGDVVVVGVGGTSTCDYRYDGRRCRRRRICRR